MNYDSEELQDALSAEYVLGTLDGKARLRYERMIVESTALRKNVWRWEQKLNELGESLPALEPSEKAWNTVEQRLGFSGNVVLGPWETASQEPARSTKVAPESPSSRGRIGVGRAWWQANLAAATVLAASIIFAVILWPQPQAPVSAIEQLAVVQGAKSEALWLIKIRKNTLEVQATGNIAQDGEHDYELWMLAEDGRAPISLGILPKQGRDTLPRPALFDQIDIVALAVSLEPLGGSATGSPTRVLYTTQLVNI